jgi:hypothetical protein
MALLFRLPLMLLELLLRRVLRRGDDATATVVTDAAAEAAARPARTPGPPPPPSAPEPTTPGPAPAFTGASAKNGAPPPPTVDEALERTAEREAAEAVTPPPAPTPLRPIGDAGHVDSEPTIVESFGDPDDVGSTITVDEPWPGYDRDSAGTIVARLRDADPATKGVVALYERTKKNRKSVLKAAG